jgi:protein-S-isoprenylcysteine O-methyltransferase Ste14
LWVLPTIIFEQLSGNWAPLLDTWQRFGGVHLQLTALVALVGVSAVQEFALRGRGTPIPFDPPRRLVTSGPYAYVANPMQLSSALVFIAWGIVLQNVWVMLGGPMTLAYALGLAASDEHSDLLGRFGKPWRVYRRHVRAWIPRWRPYHASIDGLSVAPPARLYVAAGCGKCSEVGRWFVAHKARGLEVVPAELHPQRDLSRITYDAGDGSGDEGVAAVARALEHIHLGWAIVGWMMRLPGMTPVLQLLVDASGGEPRLVRRLHSNSESCAA